jgi:hypothetical protein
MLCSLWGTDCILNYYLEELRLYRVKFYLHIKFHLLLLFNILQKVIFREVAIRWSHRLVHGWWTYGTRDRNCTRDFFWACGTHCCPSFFLNKHCCIIKKVFSVYECVGIAYDYHYYKMKLRVNNFLHKLEAVRSYWLPKQAARECFQLLCFLSSCNNFCKHTNDL